MKKFLIGTQHSILDSIKPASSYIPDWYKKLPQWITGKPEILESDYSSSKGIKTCVPFLESFTTGYMLELSQDVQVKANQNGYDHVCSWQYQPIPPLDVRSQVGLENMPSPEGFSSLQHVWKNPFAFKTPAGYSMLVTHPLNRYDLPFYTLSGVIDSDNGVSTGNLPFYFKLNFDGIIPKGTPIAQIFLFKREQWTIERNDKELSAMDEKLIYESNSVISGFYKKNLWKRKFFG